MLALIKNTYIGLAATSLPSLLALLFATSCAFGQTGSGDRFAGNVRMRGSLDNSRRVFERTGRGSVAFIGGSITEMNGFRPLVCDSLKRRFPGTAFTFTNAGVASTCSTTGAFRLDTDVLSKGPVDLLFIEFAVNDDQDAHHTRAECIRGMEGIVRQALRRNPNMDLVVTYFVNEEMLQTLRGGGVPLPIEAHEAVAARYTVPTIDVAAETAREITAGTLTWEAYGGTHPGPVGSALCARMIDALFDRAWAKPLAMDAPARPHRVRRALLDPMSYERGRFLGLGQARLKSGWTLGIPDWSRLAGSKRDRFTSAEMLSATVPGSELTLDFTGTTVAAYILAGPDAGIAEASIDGGPYRAVELYHAFSSGLHYPRTVLLGTDLRPGRHTLALRISSRTQSAGHAMRILHFAVN